MRVLQVITSMRIGGAEKLVSEIAPMMCEKGYQVDVALFDGTDTCFKHSLEAVGIKVISFGKGGSVYSLRNLLKLIPLIRHYDIVHTHNTAPQLFAAIGSVVCSVVLVTTEHTTSNRRRDWRWYVWVDKWMYSHYRKIICISNQAETNLRNYLGTAGENIVTIFNGVDIMSFRKALPAEDIRMDGCIIVTMVAGFRYQKDQETLIRAFSLLPRGKYKLCLVGDGKRKSVLENLTEELGLQKDVRFLGIRNDVPQVLKASDIIVMSSHFEGLSLSNIEGMSVDKPFIASDVDGLHEMTVGAGILFPQGDYEQLAKEIQYLAEDKEYSNMIAGRCLKRASEYDIRKMVDAYLKVYDSLV